MSRRPAFTLALILLAPAARAAEPAPDRYPFAVPPLAAFDLVAGLPGSAAQSVPAAERACLTAAWDRSRQSPAARPAEDTAAVLDAMLFASGVESVDARAKYRAQVDRL